MQLTRVIEPGPGAGPTLDDLLHLIGAAYARVDPTRRKKL